jgi:hypothetical protein
LAAIGVEEMSEQIDWSKAPEDATHCWAQAQDFFKLDHGNWMVWYGNEMRWAKSTMAERWGGLVERPTTPSWSGEGLPPVGVVCEVKQMARGAEREWFKAEVLYSSHYTVVLDDYQAGEFVSHPCTLQFRPIRTPEQIAADERTHEIRNALTSISHKVEKVNTDIDCSLAIAETVSAMIDAGYRKP